MNEQEHVRSIKSPGVLEYMGILGYQVLHSCNVIIMSQMYHIRCQMIACQVITDRCQMSSNSMVSVSISSKTASNDNTTILTVE